MAERSRGGIFRKRNVLGLTLIAGMVVGTYLPNIWKGFGGGSTWGIGIGDPADGLQIETKDASTDDELDATIPAAQPQPQSLIKVIIDERSFFIRSETGDRPTELTEIITLATAATGDADGFVVQTLAPSEQAAALRVPTPLVVVFDASYSTSAARDDLVALVQSLPRGRRLLLYAAHGSALQRHEAKRYAL